MSETPASLSNILSDRYRLEPVKRGEGKLANSARESIAEEEA